MRPRRCPRSSAAACASCDSGPSLATGSRRLSIACRPRDDWLLARVRSSWRLATPRAGELILAADNSRGFLASRTSSDAVVPGVHGGPSARPLAFLVAYGVSPYTNLITLSIYSDREGDAIVHTCEDDVVHLNGRRLTIDGAYIACGGENGPEAIEVFGGGGSDTIGLTGVSEAAGFTNICCANQDPEYTDEVYAEGEDGADTIIGGPFSERLNSLARFDFSRGPDTVTGGAGTDRIHGTTQGDTIRGGAGADRIEPGPGGDNVWGGGGADFIEDPFAPERDVIRGEGGRDWVVGGKGGDLLDGGPGRDYLDGQDGPDTLLGRAGDDGLHGGGGPDRPFGHDGDDTLRGGGGKRGPNAVRAKGAGA